MRRPSGSFMKTIVRMFNLFHQNYTYGRAQRSHLEFWTLIQRHLIRRLQYASMDITSVTLQRLRRDVLYWWSLLSCSIRRVLIVSLARHQGGCSQRISQWCWWHEGTSHGYFFDFYSLVLTDIGSKDLYKWGEEEIMVLKDDDPKSPLYPVRQTVVRLSTCPCPFIDWHRSTICSSLFMTHGRAIDCSFTVREMSIFATGLTSSIVSFRAWLADRGWGWWWDWWFGWRCDFGSMKATIELNADNPQWFAVLMARLSWMM